MPHLETGTDVFFFCWCLWDPCEIPLHCFVFFGRGGLVGRKFSFKLIEMCLGCWREGKRMQGV